MDIAALCQDAVRLYDANPAKAFELLDGSKDLEGFYPWAAFCQLQLFLKSGRTAEADDLCERLYTGFPDIEGVWGELLKLAHIAAPSPAEKREKIRRTTKRLRQSLRKADRLTTPWLKPLVIECACYGAWAASKPIIEKAVRDALFTPVEARILESLNRFLEALRRDLRLEKKRCPGPLDGFKLTFGDGPCARVLKDGKVEINLSHLRLGDVPMLMRDHSPLIVAILCEETNGSRLKMIDLTDGRWDGVGEADLYNILVPKMFLPYLTSHEKKADLALRIFKPQPGELWARPGNGQLCALRAYLNDPEGARDAAVKVAHLLEGPQEALFKLNREYDWWPRIDPLRNIAMIAQNAGWYAPPEEAADALSRWADGYVRVLRRGNLLSIARLDVMALTPLLPELRHKPLWRFSASSFLRIMDQARIVFVSGFADQVGEKWRDGSLEAFWRALTPSIRPDAVTVVSAPVSAYPYRPHRSWLDSFNKLLEATSKAVESSQATVVIASCGGYGVPLVEAIHTAYGISAISNGHMSNMFFGIRTRDVARYAFYRQNARVPYWTDGDLSKKFPILNNIDDGRYGARIRK